MSKTGTEIVPHLCGFYRTPAESVALDASGDGELRFPTVPAGYVWLIDTVTIAGSSPGGARVTLYRDSTTDPDRIIGTVELGATDPAAIFQSDGDTTWLRGGETLIAKVEGAGASSTAVGTVSYRLAEIEERAWGGAQAVAVVAWKVEPPAIEEPAS